MYTWTLFSCDLEPTNTTSCGTSVFMTPFFGLHVNFLGVYLDGDSLPSRLGGLLNTARKTSKNTKRSISTQGQAKTARVVSIPPVMIR